MTESPEPLTAAGESATSTEEPLLTESEAVVAVPLIFAAAAMTAGWVLDRAGREIHPGHVVATALLLTALAAALIMRRPVDAPPSFSWRRFAGFALVFLVFTAYVGSRAWPSLLPLTDGPDLVHHLSLVDFIHSRHALPHDPALGAYLGEMASYTPGSHLLAASAADWLRVDPLQIMHPLQSVAVGLKAGLIYNTLTRILPGPGLKVASALAGTLLLLLPFRYLLDPVTHFGFYSQVVAEMFAVAMLWTAVVWHAQPFRARLALAGVFAVGVALCWPVYFPAPALALALVVLLRRKRSPRAIHHTLIDLLVALGPGVVTIGIFSARQADSAGILRSGGSVLIARPDVFGWPFLLLVAAGLLMAIRRISAMAPVLVFTAACVAQIAALAIVQTWLGATNLYLANKTVFLLVFPMTICAALALDGVCRFIAHTVRSALGGAGGRGIASACALVAIAALLLVRDVPVRPLTSPMTEPMYRVGMWAKSNVPAGCVDYLVGRWITGYWLHLDVLGNPRASERMRTETFEYRPTVSRWIVPDGAPFAIVERLADVPSDARRNMEVLYTSGAAAVVRRVDRGGRCADDAPGIDRIGGRSR